MSLNRGSTSPNGTNAGTRAGDEALALVSAPQPSSLDRGELGTLEVAERLRKSPAWVKRHAHELQGRLVGGVFRFPAIEVERRRTTVERITVGGHTRGEENVGPRAASIFARLEAGESTSQIVRELEEPPEFVARMREAWLRGYEDDRRGLSFVCSCGAASDPATARCARCHTRTRTLTDDQMALLAGADLPPPGTCVCRGCHARVRVEDADSLCTTCMPKLSITERGGVLAAMLAGRVVRELSVVETRAVVGRLAHHLPPKEASA
jgi:hypothetical protein